MLAFLSYRNCKPEKLISANQKTANYTIIFKTAIQTPCDSTADKSVSEIVISPVLLCRCCGDY